jgi:predicted nucleic acid-binding protein
LDEGKQERAAEAAAFFHSYSGEGTQFVSSPYALQEVANALAKHTLKKQRRHGRWKELRHNDYPTFLTLRAEALSIIVDAWTRFQEHGILFVVPNDGDESPYGVTVTNEVVEVAFLLLKEYEALDEMDAFHIALGMACGVSWFVTTDAGWKEVAEINVFCDN